MAMTSTKTSTSTLIISIVLSIGHSFFVLTTRTPSCLRSIRNKNNLRPHLGAAATKMEMNNHEQEQPFRFHNLTDTERIFCISDLHTDHQGNMEWLETMAQTNPVSPTDLLIVAGDISHQLSTTFRSSLRILRSQCRVLFVPGNHEAWLTAEDKEDNNLTDSLQKLQACYEVCRQEDVYVDPVWVGTGDPSSSSVWILPLESWYDGSLSFDESLCEGFEHWPWVDFVKCIWPPQFPPASNDPHTNLARIPLGLVDYFLQRNEEIVLQPWKRYIQEQHENTQRSRLVTVSHFLPNQQCLPDWKDLTATEFSPDWLDHGAGTTSAKFAKVAGSSALDDQLDKYGSHVHIFGHSHRPKDITLNGCRYVHHPLGKPRERAWHMINPQVKYLCVWEQGHVVPVDSPVIRFWEEEGGGVIALRERLAEEKEKRRIKSSSIRRNN